LEMFSAYASTRTYRVEVRIWVTWKMVFFSFERCPFKTMCCCFLGSSCRWIRCGRWWGINSCSTFSKGMEKSHVDWKNVILFWFLKPWKMFCNKSLIMSRFLLGHIPNIWHTFLTKNTWCKSCVAITHCTCNGGGGLCLSSAPLSTFLATAFVLFFTQ
jgi:hypothetical protein